MQEEIKQGTMKMDDAWTKFCTSLDKDSFHESLDIQNQMKTSNFALKMGGSYPVKNVLCLQNVYPPVKDFKMKYLKN